MFGSFCESGAFHSSRWMTTAFLFLLVLSATPRISGQKKPDGWKVQTNTDQITGTTTFNIALMVPTESNGRRGEAEVTADCGRDPGNHILSFTIDYHSPSDRNPKFETSVPDSTIMPDSDDMQAAYMHKLFAAGAAGAGAGIEGAAEGIGDFEKSAAEGVADEEQNPSMVKFRARIDHEPVVAWSRDKYSNELVLSFFDGWEKLDILGYPLGKNEMPPAGSLSQGIYAHRILVELPLVNGDRPIVDIRLDDPVFRKFVAGCRFPHVEPPGPPGAQQGLNASAGVARTMQERGLNISAGVANTMLIVGEAPVYPPAARAAGVSGTVVLQALIGADGLVHKLTPISSPSPSLTAAATQAVSTRRYRPYLLNGKPVAVNTTINVTFR